MIDFSRNHFELFGLAASYRVDDAALERAYRELQSAVHPDRFARGSDTEKRLALQSSARVNEGYRTLRDPVARAEYLLSLRGIDATAETDNRLPVAFLSRQLERREEAEEAFAAQDAPALSRLIDDIRGEADELRTEVARALEAGDDETARTRVRELRFISKVADDLEALAAAEAER
jgi:molecular chaperone HscB